jgi:TrmH family RNA methyltransferase
MSEITSHHNAQLKEIRKLTQRRRAREQAGRFVAEGEDLLAAADAAGWEPVARLCATGSGLGGRGWVEVEPALLAEVSELGSGTRTMAVFQTRWAPAATGPLCVALYGVGDPGNVGTILRGAAAFGAACVALGPDCADPFGPKAVRASMGAIFEVPVVRLHAGDALPGSTIALVTCPESPVRGTRRGSAGSVTALADTELGDAVTLLIGAEREGLPEAVVAAADRTARIPIASHSLNAAMAGTVALYEASRRMARE